jgi:putative transposase
MDLVSDEPDGREAAKDVVQELEDSGALDALFARIDSGEIELTGDRGLIPALIKAALERGLQAELSDHLGYDKGAPEAALFSNSRNGTTPKTLASQVGDVPLDVPRDREGSFTWTLGAWRPGMECCLEKPWRGYEGSGMCRSGPRNVAAGRLPAER